MLQQKSSASYTKSVLKTLGVLEQFIESNKEKGIRELSYDSGIPASTMQRLVNTLESKGYLMQNPNTGKYRLGLTLYHLYRSFAHTFNWVDQAKHYMECLVDKYNETINLAFLEGQHIVYLTKVDSKNILRPNFEVGTKYPAFCTALGKCLLANLTEDTINILFATESTKKLTSKTKTSIEEILEDLFIISEQGYAVDDEEFQDDLRCVAVPIRNSEGIVVASMSVSAPINRMPMEKIIVVKEDLLETARKISSLIE